MSIILLIVSKCVWIFTLLTEVTSQCNNLQTCYQCGVACGSNTVNGVSQSDCIAYIDQTSVHAVEYHPSETKCVYGSCTGLVYKMPIDAFGITANLDVRTFRYSCTTDCPVFSIKEDAFQRVSDTPTSTHIDISKSECLALCLDTEYCYIADYDDDGDEDSCYMHADCGPSNSCSISFSWSSKVFKRSCLANCSVPQAPTDGQVSFTDLVTGSEATIDCDVGFVEVTGSNTQTCQADGTWSLPQPICQANVATTTPPPTATSRTTLPPATTTIMTSSVRTTTTITQSSSTISPAVKIYIMPCICYVNKTFTGMTNEEIIELLIKETEIDTKSTASAKNKLISKEDNRPASKAVGFIGLAFLIALFGTMILSDAIIAIFKIREMIANKIREKYM